MLFAEAPSFVERMEDQVTVVDSTAVMQCMTSGSPLPKVTWLKDGVVLVPTLRHFFTADDQLLIIVQTAVTDTGNYTCVTTNVLGSDRQVGHSHRCDRQVVHAHRCKGCWMKCIKHRRERPCFNGMQMIND